MSTHIPDPADLRALSSAIDRVFAENADGPISFEEPDTDTRRTLWATAHELAWPLIGLPEDQGGADGSLDELTVLMEQVGRWLAPGPFLGTALYASVLAAGPVAPMPTIDLVAPRGAGFGLIDWGRDRPIDHKATTHPLFFAPGDVEVGLLLAPDRVDLVIADGAPWTDPSLLFDPTLEIGRVSSTAERRTVLCGAPAERVWVTSKLLVAAYLVGIAERTLRTAVEYAKTREQFGRPIGSYQAVKHRCADMAIREMAARAAVELAVDHVGADGEAFEPLADAALSLAVEAALVNAEACLETHGAMGFTWEFGGHRFLKRAHVLRAIVAAGARGEHR